MNKLLTTTGISIIIVCSAQAATVTWNNDGGGSSWQTDDNWDTNTHPATNDEVIIDDGTIVTHNPAFGNDHLIIDGGGSLSISNSSGLSQSSAFGEEVMIDSGILNLDNATYSLAFGGSLTMLAQDTGGSGMINATNNSSITVAGEIWLGSVDSGESNQSAQINLTNSSIDANGGVGIWLWDTDAASSDIFININGAGSTIEGRIGRRNGGGQNNSVTWETLWNEGNLKFNGGNTGNFSDHFTTSGTAGTTGYTLTSIAVPEPSSAALLGLGGIALILRRRK